MPPHVHLKTVPSDSRNPRPYSTKAHDPESPAIQLDPGPTVAEAKLALAHRSIRLVHHAHACKHHADHVFSDRDGIGLRRIDHRNSAGGSRIEIDIVDPDAVSCNHL